METEKSLFCVIKEMENRDFPGGSVTKTPCTQCRGLEFDPYLGN